MNVSRLEPYGLFDLLNRNLDPAWVRRRRTAGGNSDRATDWIPAVDVIEEKERFVLQADLPGMTPDQIDIRMDKGVLSLSGERARDNDSENVGLQRLERMAGKFERRFTLPETADAENISARSRNGTLEITIPKLPEIQQRRITVDAA